MNLFKVKLNHEDLGHTYIENAFVSHYMPFAPGNYVKVYLLGLKYAQSYVNNTLSNETIAKTLGITAEEVLSAWKYWEEQGIIKLVPYSVENKDGDYTVEYLSIKEIVLNIKEKKETTGKYSPERIINARSNHQIRDLFEYIRRAFGRELSPNDLFAFLDWLDDYHMTPDTVKMIVDDCLSRDKKDMHYLKQVAKNWFDAGINTADKAREYTAGHKEKWHKYGKVLNFLRIGRQPTAIEEGMMHKWFYLLELNEEVVLKACEMTSKTLKPSFNYIDKILTEWHDKGLVTLQEIEAYILKTASNEAPKSGGKNNKTAKPTFNNFENRNYDAKALEQALLKKSRGELSE